MGYYHNTIMIQIILLKHLEIPTNFNQRLLENDGFE